MAVFALKNKSVFFACLLGLVLASSLANHSVIECHGASASTVGEAPPEES